MHDPDIEKFLKILPTLIKENDTVKGAILTALSGVVATREDIKEIIREMDRRFEQVDRRFEQVDRRLDQIDKQLNLQGTELGAHGAELKSLRWNVGVMTVTLARMESKEGEYVERVIIDLMKDILALEKIDPQKIRKEYIQDPEGAVFFPGYSSDIDIILEDGKVYAIEIKGTASSQDVAHFLANVRLWQKQSGKVPAQLILVTLRISPKTKQIAESRHIRVIAGELLRENIDS